VAVMTEAAKALRAAQADIAQYIGDKIREVELSTGLSVAHLRVSTMDARSHGDSSRKLVVSHVEIELGA
jgi:hypothetical protein